MARISTLPPWFSKLRRSLELYVAHRHTLGDYATDDWALAECYARENGLEDWLWIEKPHTIAVLALQPMDSKLQANRSLHQVAKRAAVVIQGARKHGKKAILPDPGLEDGAAAYRAMLAGLFDIAILDTMTFERRPEGGQLLLEVRRRLWEAHARNYGLSRYAADRAINHRWPGIFDEHGIDPCRRDGNIPHRDSKGIPYGGVEMRAALAERFGENCAACQVPMDRFALHVDHIVALSKGGDSEIENSMLLCPECDSTKAALSVVGLLAILERKRREARGGGMIDC